MRVLLISLLLFCGNIQPIYAQSTNKPKVKVVWKAYDRKYRYYGYTVKNPSSTEVLTDVKVHIHLADEDTTYLDYTVTISELLPKQVYRYGGLIESSKKAKLTVEYESNSSRSKKKSDASASDLVEISNLNEGLNSDGKGQLYEVSGDVSLAANHTDDEEIYGTFVLKKDDEIVYMSTEILDTVEPGTSEAFVARLLLPKEISKFEYDTIEVYPEFRSTTDTYDQAVLDRYRESKEEES